MMWLIFSVFRQARANHVTMSRRGFKVKDSDVFKAVKENNRNKFLVGNFRSQNAQSIQEIANTFQGVYLNHFLSLRWCWVIIKNDYQ